MGYTDPAKLIARLLNASKATLLLDDVLVGDRRVPVVGRAGAIISASPIGMVRGGAAQGYLANVLIYCPDTTTSIKTTKDGIDKAFAVAGRIDALMKTTGEGGYQDTLSGALLVNPACSTPFQAKDPISELDVVSISIDFNLVQGV